MLVRRLWLRISRIVAHALSRHGEAVGVVNETIQHGVGEGGIADDLVPAVHGDLAGDEGRSVAVAVRNPPPRAALLDDGKIRHCAYGRS